MSETYYNVYNFIHTKELIIMQCYREYDKDALKRLKEELEAVYKKYQGYRLNLNMTRGKPSPDQLDLSMEMLNTIDCSSPLSSASGDDCRNYGLMDGTPEAKKLMAGLINIDPGYLMVHGASSLNIMYDLISHSFSHGVAGNTPWYKLDKIKFLCPVPGYDRHFAITEFFGIEMINIPMNEAGPDMDLVEQYVTEDAAVKGIWCVPQYSNPGGTVYSDEVVRRFADLKPAAKDFRIYWDNSYCVHHLYFDEPEYVLDILRECEKAGNPDMVYEFLSTSKISFAGSGIAAVATSENNRKDLKRFMSLQFICQDKINQLRHARYLKDRDSVLEHMKKHAALLTPKFEAVDQILHRELDGLGIGTWTTPKGGYFISFQAMEGCAASIVSRCKEAGVVLTEAGATYPYGKDPADSNIRIAPSYPSPEELMTATEVFALCVKLASIEKLLNDMSIKG
jgi:DNA-binding transcriptional MocR family regulator